MSPLNTHAVALVLGDKGIVVLGPSGSGKTTLALALITHVNACGRFARLVADDQLLLSARGERIVAAVPGAIAGLAEAYGAGPAALPHLRCAVIDLAVKLVEPADAPRLCEGVVELVPGRLLPLLELPCRNAGAGLYPVMARLGLPPFSRTSPDTGRKSGESPQIGACQHAPR